MRNEGKRKGRGGRALLWAALLSACLFAVSPALAEGESGRETVASEGSAWLLSAGEAALRAAEKNADPTKTASWVQKIWEDSAYSGKRPASIRCRLYRNGAAMAQTVTLREGNKWHAGIGGLDRYEETGKDIEWVWKEISPSDSGYYAQEPPRIEPHTEIIGIVEYTGTQTVLVNRLTVAQLTVEKIWLDDTAKDRPKELTVTLTREDAAGKAYAGDEGTRTVTLTAADADGTDNNLWRHTVANLPVREGDVWRVTETVPKGYRAEGEAGSAETVSGAITPDRLTLTNRKEHRPPSGGGGSGQGGGRRTAPLEPEEEPEDALPEEIPDVGAPWRTLAILLLSGLALLGVGAVLACAGKRTRRLGYGAMAFGVALAALTIPFASRYLSESGASAGMLESVRAELAAALWGGAPAQESAEQPDKTGPDGVSGRPEAQEAEPGSQTQPEDRQDENGQAQPGDGSDESAMTGGNGISGPGKPPEAYYGNDGDARTAADDRPMDGEHPETGGEAGAPGESAGYSETGESAAPAPVEQTEARGELAGNGETDQDAPPPAEEGFGVDGRPDGRGESGAGGKAAGQTKSDSAPDPAEEARVKELAQKLSDHALLAIRQAFAPAPAVKTPDNGDADRTDSEPAAVPDDASVVTEDGAEPAQEAAPAAQTGEPEEASQGASGVAEDGAEPAQEANPAAQTGEPEEASQGASGDAGGEREPAQEAAPAAQTGEPEEVSHGASGVVEDGAEPAQEAAPVTQTGGRDKEELGENTGEENPEEAGAPDARRTLAPGTERAPADADRELPVRWINGRRCVGTASAPSLALTWPVQADWRGDCLSVSPGVFCGNPYGDRFILIGHNYPTHFGTIEDLQPGDEVVFRDFGDSGFRYSVLRIDYLMPDEMDALLNDPAALTLVTCARDGNRRVAVRCERTE